MRSLRPSLHALRALAGEGNYHAYSLLKTGSRGFLFIKYMLISFTYGFHLGHKASEPTVALIKGTNQFRFYKQQQKQLLTEFGKIELFSVSRITKTEAYIRLPRFSALEICQQLAYLFLLLISGKKRYLDMYYLAFFAAITRVVDRSFSNLQNFICFNDQPYDIAAIVLAIEAKNTCKTIVIQHGLILSEAFYFPSNAAEFRAWGPLSRTHFKSRNSQGELIITGRYFEDNRIRQPNFLFPKPKELAWRILIAPSHKHHEIKLLVNTLRASLQTMGKSFQVGLKLHPATKAKWLVSRWLRQQKLNIKLEYADMENLSEKYEMLFTKNSTSAVDFLLRGKPVAFSEFNQGNQFPSNEYGITLDQIQQLFEGKLLCIEYKNTARLKFIERALFV